TSPMRRSRGNEIHFSLPASICAVIAILLLATSSDATSPRITSITPTGAQRGTNVELRLAGSRLDDTREIIFYEPGIQVEKLDTAKTNSVTAQIKIGSACPLGEYHFRLRTASGISELKTFPVGPFPV